MHACKECCVLSLPPPSSARPPLEQAAASNTQEIAQSAKEMGNAQGMTVEEIEGELADRRMQVRQRVCVAETTRSSRSHTPSPGM